MTGIRHQGCQRLRRGQNQQCSQNRPGYQRLLGRLGLLLAAVMLLALHPVSASAAVSANAEAEFTVLQKVTGDKPWTPETFTFTLTGLAGAPMPGGSVNGTKTAEIKGDGSVSFGTILFPDLGEYHYQIVEEKGKNPLYTYDAAVYAMTVLVTWKGVVGGEKEATLYLLKDSGTEKQDKILFTNRYTLPPAPPAPTPVSIDPPVRKTVKGAPKQDAVFTFHLSADEPDNPMPADSSGGLKAFQITGSGETDLGVITYTRAGVYSYTVYEVNAGLPGYQYDTTVYTMTVSVTEANGKLVQSTGITRADGSAASGFSFVNTWKSKEPADGHSDNTTEIPDHTTDIPGHTTNIPDQSVPSPKTGDVSNPVYWGAMLAISGAVGITLLIRKIGDRKKDKRKKNKIR